MKNKIRFLIFVLVFLMFAPLVKATSGFESVNPKDGFNYGVKRFREKVNLILTFSDQGKSNLYFKFLERRLSELKFTVMNEDRANFESATKRYFTAAGQYVEFLKNKKVTYDKEALLQKFSEHAHELKILRDKYDSASAEWRFIQDDINYLDLYLKSLP